MALIHTILNGAGVVLFVVFFFGFCVFIHEFGHLLAAKWRGLHVESFSIGFGKKLWGFTYKGVDYKVSMLPFGGYVELPQLETANEHSDARGNPLPKITPLDRMITAVAGPLFNILFGLFLGSFVWIFGKDAPPPGSEMRVVKVTEGSVEYTAGLRRNDVIYSVNGETFKQGWLDVRDLIMTSRQDNVTLGVIRDKARKKITYPLLSSEFKMADELPYPNFSPATICDITGVKKRFPGGKAGLKKGDQYVSVNGEEIFDGSGVIEAIRKVKGKGISIVVKRDGKEVTIDKFDAIHAQAYYLGYKAEKGSSLKVASVTASSPAGKAGLKEGDKILSINGVEVSGQRDMGYVVSSARGANLALTVERGGEKVALEKFNAMSENEYNLGLTINEDGQLAVAHLEPDSPLKLKAKLKAGDKIVSVNSQKFDSAKALNKYVNKNHDLPFVFEVIRLVKKADEKKKQAAVYKDKSETVDAVKAYPVYLAGLTNSTKPDLVKVHPTPIQQMTEVVSRTVRTAKALFSSKSKVKVKHMSGPIGIVKVMGQAVSHSFMTGLSLVVFISFSLAFMNLLPIPVLDGGHITFSFIEMVIRRKLPVKIISKLELFFGILLIGFMLYVTVFSDGRRLLPDGDEQTIEYRQI